MKIAFLINNMEKGGAQRVIVNLMSNFLKCGDEVLLITYQEGENEYEIPDGVRRVRVDFKNAGGSRQNALSRGTSFFARLRVLRKTLKKEKSDSTIAFIGKTNLMLLFASRFLPGRYFVSVRGTPSEEYYSKTLEFCAKHCFSWADGVILQTTPSLDYFPKRVRKKAHVLPNPLNPQFLRPIYEGEREPKIVAVGRIDENKNHRMIMKAYEKMLSKHPEMSNYELVIYGDGDMRNALSMEAEEIKNGTVRLPGQITDVAEAIEKSALYILSSNTEGMPNSLMEAMALGLPVISTDCPCGGPKTLIEDGVNGCLVPVNDADRLAEVMYMILSNKEYGKMLGQAAGRIQEDCAPDRVASMWRNFVCVE